MLLILQARHIIMQRHIGTPVDEKISTYLWVQLVYLRVSILGPLWVWLVIRETSPRNTNVGGSMLLISVAWFAHHSLREEARRH